MPETKIKKMNNKTSSKTISDFSKLNSAIFTFSESLNKAVKGAAESLVKLSDDIQKSIEAEYAKVGKPQGESKEAALHWFRSKCEADYVRSQLEEIRERQKLLSDIEKGF